MLDNKKRINSKADLDDWLRYELYEKYGKNDSIMSRVQDILKISEESLLRYHIILLRKTEYYINTKKKIRALIYKARLRKFQYKYAMHIPINCCGRGFQIVHIGPILINGKATIGENCSFHINTAVVAGGTNDGVPVLDDGVVMGIGSVALGNIYVSKNVAIGANAVVNKSVEEENVTVAGVPAKKVSDSGRLEWNKKS
ncbi:MAG: hypothetical protein IJA07_07920 [Agathobacter sp.]|nr:hypothetical protein [Agathobacter sp.]